MIHVEFTVADKTGLAERRYAVEDRELSLRLSLVSFGTFTRKSKRHPWVQVTGWHAVPFQFQVLKKAGVTPVEKPVVPDRIREQLLAKVRAMITWELGA